MCSDCVQKLQTALCALQNLLPPKQVLNSPTFGNWLHARCAAINPEVTPLPGQDTNPSIIDQQQQQQQQWLHQVQHGSIHDDYFAALGSGIDAAASSSNRSLHQLAKLLLAAAHSDHSTAAAAAAAAASSSDQQQQRQRLQVLLCGCILQRLQVLQQRLLRVTYWCPAGMTVTAARQQARQQQQQPGGEIESNQRSQSDKAHEPDSTNSSSSSSSDDDDNRKGHVVQDVDLLPQQQQRLLLHDDLSDEAQHLVQLLLQPLQEQQQVVDPVYFEHLVSSVDIWVNFASQLDLAQLLHQAVATLLQQQQQPDLAAAAAGGGVLVTMAAGKMLGLCHPQHAAAAAGPAWLLLPGFQEKLLQALLEHLANCLTQLAAGSSGSVALKQLGKKRVSHEQGNLAAASSSSDQVAGLARVLLAAAHQISQQQQQRQQQQTSGLISGADSMERPEGVIPDLVTGLYQHFIRMLKARRSSPNSSSGSSSSSALEQRLQQLLLLLQLLLQLPLHSFDQQRGCLLSLLTVTAVAAVLHLWAAAAAAAAAAAGAGLILAHRCLLVALRVLDRLDHWSCGLAAVGQLLYRQQQQQSVSSSKWHKSCIHLLLLAGHTAAAAAAGDLDLQGSGSSDWQQQQHGSMIQLCPVLTRLIISHLTRSDCNAPDRILLRIADTAVDQLRAANAQLVSPSGTAAAGSKMPAAAAAATGDVELFTASVVASAVLAASSSSSSSSDKVSEVEQAALDLIKQLLPVQQQHHHHHIMELEGVILAAAGGDTSSSSSSRRSVSVAAAAALCYGLCTSSSLLLAAAGELSDLADRAAALITDLAQPRWQQQQLQLLAFVHAAGLVITKTSSSSSSGGGSLDPFQHVINRYSLLLAAAAGLEASGSSSSSSSSSIAWPVLPADYITLDDLIMQAAVTDWVTDQITQPDQQQQQQQQSVLLHGILVGLKAVVAAAGRQQQLLLHQNLCGSNSSNTTLINMPAAGSSSSIILSQVQMLLAVLESTSGAKGLKLLAAHSATYAAALRNLITHTDLAGSGDLDCPAILAAQQQQQLQLAVASWAFRCLESMIGRETTFDIPATTTAAAIQAVAAAAQQLAAGSMLAAAAAVYCSACSLLVSITRHRSPQLTRLMPHVVAACRQLLLLLLAWDQALRARLLPLPGSILANQQQQQSRSAGGVHQPSFDLLIKCAGQLGRLYEALAQQQQQQQLGRYCHHIITDYIIHMAAAVPANLAGSSSSSSADSASSLQGSCSAAVSGVVRGGACMLFGVLSPADIQGVHLVVGRGPLGSVRRAALADLKSDFDTRFKHGGKF